MKCSFPRQLLRDSAAGGVNQPVSPSQPVGSSWLDHPNADADQFTQPPALGGHHYILTWTERWNPTAMANLAVTSTHLFILAEQGTCPYFRHTETFCRCHVCCISPWRRSSSHQHTLQHLGHYRPILWEQPHTLTSPVLPLLQILSKILQTQL